MKTTYTSIVLALLAGTAHAETVSSPCLNCPSLSTIENADDFNDSTYYSSVTDAISNGLTSGEIKSLLSSTISNNHKNLTYSEVWTALTETDEDPSQPSNILLIYKGISIPKSQNASAENSSEQDYWNREHVWAKSHGFRSSSAEAYTDIHHLRPSDVSINSARSNYDFDMSDEVLDEAPENRVDSDSFEPRDAVKGDVARMMFYMDTRYEGSDQNTPDLTLVNRITSSDEPMFGMLCRLIEWHNADPVDSLEQARNDRIYEFQGNRNPFIDHPEWVETIFPVADCDTQGGDTGGGDSGGDTGGDTDGGDTGGDTETPVAASLIISEYIEGSSNNKAIELFNVSGADIDLAEQNVALLRYSNGNTSSTRINLEGTIAANGTFVIVHSSANADFKALAQQVTGSVSHNGDDAYELVIDNTVVDSFGRVGEDPGSRWGSGDTSTQNNTLRRLASITSGDVISDDEFVPGTQWFGTEIDDISGLGFHEVEQRELFISEYIEGSSNNKAIEIYNPSTSDIDLALENYKLTRFSNGRAVGEGTDVPLTGVVMAGDVYVVANTSANAEIKAQADQLTSNINHNGDDAYILYKGTAIVDIFGQVGEDPGSRWGSGESSTQNNTLVRKPTVDAGITDITLVFDPATQWNGLGIDVAANLGMHTFSGGGDTTDPVVPPIGQCYEDATLISVVQGDAERSPVEGETVIVEAAVTAVFPALGGFFIQEEVADQDENLSTSEGIFVSDKNSVLVDGQMPNIGDVVRIMGAVSESYGKTQITLTQAPVACGSEYIVATDLTLPFANETSAESIEGMLVTINSPLTVTDNYNLGRYGEVTLSNGRVYAPTNLHIPGSDEVAQLELQNELNKVLLDDGVNGQNPAVTRYPEGGLSAFNTLRLGDQVTELNGVLDYSFGEYRVIPTIEPVIVHTNERTDTPEIEEIGNLRIANANVLNLFNGDGLGGGFPTSRGADSESEYQRQLDKIVNALLAMNADIIGLQEIENDGFGEFSAIQELVNVLNQYAPAGVEFDFVNPGIEEFGGDAIKVALIYNKLSVKEIGTPATILEFPFEYHNRPPLAQSFEASNGEVLTVVVNHYRSKGCSSSGGVENEDKKDGQGCYNLRRVQAAQAVLSWLDTNPTGVDDEDVILLGDFNAYNKEDPITTFNVAGYTDLLPAFMGDESYTYSIFGQVGALDHVLTSASLTEKVVDATSWAINADEPRILDYNMEYKTDDQLVNLYSDEPFRASDHDPILVEIMGKSPWLTTTKVYENLTFFSHFRLYRVKVPADAKSLTVSLAGGVGNADLYVRQGRFPNRRHFDCAPRLSGNDEVCEFESPKEGYWYIRVRANRFFWGPDLTIETVSPKLD